MAGMGLQVESFFSEDVFAHMMRHLDRSNGLLNAFRRLSSALQQLKTIIIVDGDVRVATNFENLRGAISHGVKQTLVVTELLRGVHSLKQNESWRGRIDQELGAAMEGASSGYQQPVSCPHLKEFELQLSTRMEGLREAEDKLLSICQQIQEKTRVLFEMDGHGTVDSRFTSFFWQMLRYTPIFVLLFIIGLGRTGYSPLLFQKLLYGAAVFSTNEEDEQLQLQDNKFPEVHGKNCIHFPFGLILLCVLVLFYMYHLNKYDRRKLKKNKVFSTVNNVVHEICNLERFPVMTIVRRSACISQVKFNIERFFMENTDEVDNCINELQGLAKNF